MNIELISVGTELLLGDIVNTNTTYLSKELANLGINVFKHTTVGDNKERLLKCFETAFKTCDTVIVTGGLGPTDDDITKECVAKYFNKEFYLDDYTWEKIKKYILSYNKNSVITSNNKKQALIPKDGVILENFCGTAPGIIIEDNNKRIILMPGPPREMKDMFIKSVKPYLEKFSSKKIISKYIRFYGIGESLLEDKLKKILEEQTNPTVALYAKTGEVLIRATASSKNEIEAHNLLNEKIEEIKKIVGEYIYLIGDEDISSSQSELNKLVANILIKNKLKIAIAESITGGNLTSQLVQNSGVSASLIESIICYSNDSKINTLGVNKKIIDNYTAVSKEVAYEMVKNIAKKTNSDIAISTTGYAEHSDANKNGVVYIGIYYKEKIYVKECRFNGDRNRIIDIVSKEALNEIRKIILIK